MERMREGFAHVEMRLEAWRTFPTEGLDLTGAQSLANAGLP